MPDCFEILSRVRQYHCRALFKITKRLGNGEISHRRMRFREIWVQDEFRTAS